MKTAAKTALALLMGFGLLQTTPVHAQNAGNAPMPGIQSDKDKEDKGDPESKISDMAKDVIKKLGSGSENVTVEDLNAAREVIAKLDMQIDIEKHLNDLAAARKDREDKSAIAAAIPAAALTPPPVMMPPPAQIAPTQVVVPVAPPRATVQVERIFGAAGNYSAVITVDGNKERVHIGDKLSDDSVVTDITVQGVTLSHGKDKGHIVRVKDKEDSSTQGNR